MQIAPIQNSMKDKFKYRCDRCDNVVNGNVSNVFYISAMKLFHNRIEN